MNNTQSQDEPLNQARPSAPRGDASSRPEAAAAADAAEGGAHSTHDVSSRRADVLARIARAARTVGRNPDAVALVAVSKQQPDDRIAAALATGQRRFGENRVQEATARWAPRRAAINDLELRLIGPLQSNKAEDAVRLFDVIETLDRDKLAAALRAAFDKTGCTPKLFVQVNTGEEPQKAGVAPLDAEAFVARVREVYGLPVVGLMCIPPAAEPAAPHFAFLADLAARCGLAELSMGMSDDFETAVRLGATSVRVGSGVFGARGEG